MKLVVLRIVRLVLTAFLLFKVYGETGPWTTLTLALCIFAQEVTAYTVHELTDSITRAADRALANLRSR